ncbi:hypothetical protein ACIQFU_05630 [Streptomyces sp. NPDC093065]|uniref:hypothetical protein n=1 Tax=Streptomyces sp. NPDC093065 TaxID=3366021 RepID=UPI0037F3DD91
MSGAADPDGTAGERRARRPVLPAVGISCYVLAVIAGMYLLEDEVGAALQTLLFIVHGFLLMALIEKLGATESSPGAALFVVLASVMCVYVAAGARDDLTLQQRGNRVTATVVKEWLDPAQGRKARDHNYELEHQDGTSVPGSALKSMSDSYDVGQTVTVIEDPEGELRPQTPGQADATGDLVGAGAFGLAALCAVAWMAWRGSDTAKRRDAREPTARLRKAYQAVTRNHTTPVQQEENLRQALRTCPSDRRGYIKANPEDYPDVSHRRAARIAWEMGLRAEAAGNRGSWRFAETVVEEVPHS